MIVDIIGSNLVKKPNCFIRLQGSDIFIQILGGLIGHVIDTEEENLSILPNEGNPALVVEPETIELES